jgi:hypothetical protein
MLVNSWHLGQRRYVSLDALTNGAMLFCLELWHEASRKRSLCEIDSSVGYAVLKFKYYDIFIKIVKK